MSEVLSSLVLPAMMNVRTRLAGLPGIRHVALERLEKKR
ncbi:hypothetical protein SACS_1761 [Parasaccharibacter apium]|uniref:Uncharacterized protein n=1 Tax=Parasaccharibacter apium TaxID=1510841 RepID=A0A7U7G7E8_9PROT|nr:hypothetical protein SACS_1761 [Parasaccharibacter apium]